MPQVSLSAKERVVTLARAGLSEAAISGVLGIDLETVYDLRVGEEDQIHLPTSHSVERRNVIIPPGSDWNVPAFDGEPQLIETFQFQGVVGLIVSLYVETEEPIEHVEDFAAVYLIESGEWNTAYHADVFATRDRGSYFELTDLDFSDQAMSSPVEYSAYLVAGGLSGGATVEEIQIARLRASFYLYP